MKRVLFIIVGLAVGVSLLGSQPAWCDGDLAVIVHPESGVTTIARDELSKIFLKRLHTWSDGTRAVPVDQLPASSARQAFSRRIHDRSVINIEVYWKRMIFSGRSVPPPELRNDAEVVDFVRKTPGAVGYVDPRTDLEGVKRLRLTE